MTRGGHGDKRRFSPGPSSLPRGPDWARLGHRTLADRRGLPLGAPPPVTNRSTASPHDRRVPQGFTTRREWQGEESEAIGPQVTKDHQIPHD
jgi:hypothetical protein